MAKIIGKIVREKHGFENIYVSRPFGNETIVEPDSDEDIDSIIKAAQQAIDMVSGYARNCSIHHWHGRACTYITIQPIYGEKRDKFIGRIKELKTSGAYICRDNDFDGRVQLVVCTPSIDDRPFQCDIGENFQGLK